MSSSSFPRVSFSTSSFHCSSSFLSFSSSDSAVIFVVVAGSGLLHHHLGRIRRHQLVSVEGGRGGVQQHPSSSWLDPAIYIDILAVSTAGSLFSWSPSPVGELRLASQLARRLPLSRCSGRARVRRELAPPHRRVPRLVSAWIPRAPPSAPTSRGHRPQAAPSRSRPPLFPPAAAASPCAATCSCVAAAA